MVKFRKKASEPTLQNEPLTSEIDPSRPLHKLLEQEENRTDIGFGKQITDPSTRLVNPDGSFNVKRINNSFFGSLNLYDRLITMPWNQFFLLIFFSYAFTNCLFALIYVIVGVEHLVGVDMTHPMSQFWDAFFFSAQSLTTVGYGRIAPVGFWASLVASVESLVGLLAFALATGLMYGRFSRPVAHILFSKNAVIAPYLDLNALMFRVVNERDNQLIDVEVEVMLSRLEANPQGGKTRKYYPLELERKKVNFFPISWTIVHPITETSPIFGKSLHDMVSSDSEFMILVRATEDTFSQSVYTRTSYHSKEILWGHKFKIMYNNHEKGTTTLDLSLLSETYPVVMKGESAAEKA